MSENSGINAEVKTVEEVMELPLKIPSYQRPYCWTQENVRQLLEDISFSKESGKREYRIGSVILHIKDGVDNIVDGQQRLTTLCLIKKACDEQPSQKNDDVEKEQGKNVDNKLTFNHIDSYTHIKTNYAFISEWLSENYKNNMKDFWQYIKDSCNFVKIEVTDLSEAFQMFDSQNGRGKELEAYNLLKAYHIRAMELNSQEEKIKCDKQWESATIYDATPTIIGDANGNIDVLKQLFAEQLFRSRIWSKGETAFDFSKKDIEEFKGFTIDKNHLTQYPYQNPQLLQYLTAKFYKNVLAGTVSVQTRFSSGDGENINPFVNINQKIVNGKVFFEYIETYVEIYKRMFIDLGSYHLADFKCFFYKYCLDYDGSEDGRLSSYSFYPRGKACRSGDSYLRELYKSLVFVLFDKFGEKGLNKYYKILYRLVYLNRLISRQVRYNAVAKLPCEYFSIITQAKHLSDLTQFQQLLEAKIRENDGALDYFSKLDENGKIVKYIKEGKE